MDEDEAGKPETCELCDGKGKIYDFNPKGDRCPDCGGSGHY